MKRIYLLLIFIFSSTLLFAQNDYNALRLTKTAIGNSGCFAYLPESTGEKKFNVSYTPDSSKVYSGEFPEDGFNFSIIVVKMKDKIEDEDEREEMTISYLDYLKKQFSIEHATGYGTGHKLASSPDAIGIIDYWEDKDQVKWTIKAWADEDIIAVMMLYGPNVYPDANLRELFLNGFWFK